MRLGWCGPPDSADSALASGFDYLEVPIGPMDLEDDGRYFAARAAPPGRSMPWLVFNQFLPRTMCVVGPAVERERIIRYINRAVDVMVSAGARVVVFGSGWARNVPPGWTSVAAFEQFSDVLSLCATALAGTGIVLAVEPQNDAETNFITTLGEAVSIAASVNQPSIRVLTDLYHLQMANEPVHAVTAAGPWLAHVHVSDSGRTLPGCGHYDFGSYFTALHAAGYEGDISIEMFDEVAPESMTRAASWVRGQWALAAPRRQS